MKENILSTLCLSCMRDAGEKFETCPFCGAAAKVENQFHQLAPGSVLNGRFVVGKTLGQGGFGITYAGYDLTADTKVAIKEFYPDGGVSRQKDLYTILPYSEKKTEELFTDGRAKFLKEAQKLAKFTDTEGIVQVRDYFEENGTAYIVMEYVEGPTLIQYLNKLGQPILPSDLYILLTPIFDALERVHAQGILHRDISPDNIIVSPTTAKLLDFGAARDFSLLGEKSNTINIKAGYAPEEQYLTHGKQGPWTDVYALSATCYRAVTGKTPSSSIERLSGDDLVPPSALSANIIPAIEEVLLKGMAVRKENRYQTIKEFRGALERAVNGAPVPQGQTVVPAPKPQTDAPVSAPPVTEPIFDPQATKPASTPKTKKKWILPVCISAAVAVIVGLVLLPRGDSDVPLDDPAATVNGVGTEAPDREISTKSTTSKSTAPKSTTSKSTARPEKPDSTLPVISDTDGGNTASAQYGDPIMTVNGEEIPLAFSYLTYCRPTYDMEYDVSTAGYDALVFTGKDGHRIFEINTTFYSGQLQPNTVYTNPEDGMLDIDDDHIAFVYWEKGIDGGSDYGEAFFSTESWEIAVGDYSPGEYVDVTISAKTYPHWKYEDLSFEFQASGRLYFDKNGGDSLSKWLENFGISTH